MGIVAILSGLSLNLIYVQFFAGQLDAAHNPLSTALFLASASAVLIYGVFSGPAKAARDGIPLPKYLDVLVGPRASRVVCYLLAPLAIWNWFDLQFDAGFHIVGWILGDLGIERGSFWRDPWVVVFGLSAVVLIGVRDHLRGYACSSLWLAKIASIALAGLLIAYWGAIPAGIHRVAQNPYTQDDNYWEALGVLLFWFAVPLFLFDTLLRPEKEEEKPAATRLHWAGWLGIGVPVMSGGVLSSLIFLGVLGTVAKPLGFAAAFQPPGAIGAGKMLVASLSLLIALRLAPRLLLGLWNVRPHSVPGATVFGIMVAASLANNAWINLSNLYLSSLAVVSLAGVAAGAEAARLVRPTLPGEAAA